VRAPLWQLAAPTYLVRILVVEMVRAGRQQLLHLEHVARARVRAPLHRRIEAHMTLM
jgi:hypothetical protein